jgi:hypothetical protein
MKSPCRSGAVILGVAALMSSLTTGVAYAATEAKVSDHAYVRVDGGTDPTIAACSVNNRAQNEPTASVNPSNGQLMSSGANDYCPVQTPPVGTWAGFYYSGNGGASWTNSLLPGYPTDTSPQGQASPLYKEGLTNAGDPVQAWDDDGHLYYGGIAFNRAKPATGSIWVARYNWPSGPTPGYERTTLVSRGTPSPIFLGIFEDKVQLEVDRGVDSPYNDNVYVCWARFTASGQNNGVFLARSSDGGVTFKSQRLSESIHDSQFCDIAVTRSGAVHVAWRQFEFDENSGQLQANAVVAVRSTNGGKSFTKPAVVQKFTGWDPSDSTVNAAAYGQAKHDACMASDGTLGACANAEPKATARDCGDGPFACQSGYVFARTNSQVRITADPSGDPDEAFIVYDGSVPGSAVPTGTTYGTAGSGTGTQAAVFLTSTSNGGSTWSAARRVDPQAKGHQFFPDVAAEDGKLHAVWQDSRFDTATGLSGDWRTVPIGNRQVAANPPGAVSTGGPLQTFYATSGDGGATWTVQQVSTAATQPQYEQFGDRDVPFFGDYNYVAAGDGKVLMTWTDQRDTVPGNDPRYTNGDGTDGFDVNQCRTQNADGVWSADTCPNAGGLDQNIYGAVADG